MLPPSQQMVHVPTEHRTPLKSFTRIPPLRRHSVSASSAEGSLGISRSRARRHSVAEERTPARTYKHKTLLSEITQSASKSKAHTSAEDTKRRLRSIPIRRFPKLLEERVSEISSRSLAATDLKQDLRRMKTERATI